jgi:DNA-binding NtrC family response regulator
MDRPLLMIQVVRWCESERRKESHKQHQQQQQQEQQEYNSSSSVMQELIQIYGGLGWVGLGVYW